MADNNVTTTTETTTTEAQPIKKDFWATYSKPIIYVGGAVIILIAGYFGYKKFVVEPKEIKANEAVFQAESLFDKMATTGFNKDSINIVLNGGTVDNANITGLLKIISTYSGTKAANRANYMVGAAYLQNKEFDKAIKYLNDFSSNGAYQLDIKKNILLGHAYAELKKTDDALSAYKKATTINDKDEALTADALIIAAAYAQSLGKKEDAISLYQKAKDNYPAFPAVQNGDVDKNLAVLGVTK
ncbi:tetratricopeptide repeat protein [Ferruginibacter yonginensis]|uniref:Tetratricopeptide repeat protein n=1 Tax=Ferruginibacter yonginensis TaxID=1310416 RepID=A0ABV8QRB9_9BACT